MKPVNVFDYEAIAQAKMEPALWDFYQGGSDDEVTMRDCRAASKSGPVTATTYSTCRPGSGR